MIASFAILVAVGAVFLLNSCESTSSNQPAQQIKPVSANEMKVEYATEKDGFKIVVIDSCEYISYYLGWKEGLLTHKGNCKYCAERNKK